MSSGQRITYQHTRSDRLARALTLWRAVSSLARSADATHRCLPAWAAEHPAAVDHVWRRGEATPRLDRPLRSYRSGELAAWHAQRLTASPEDAADVRPTHPTLFIDCGASPPGRSFIGSVGDRGGSRGVDARS